MNSETINARIGFMQGRLSPLIDGKIQCFPWPYWRDEFAASAKIGLRMMEWTLDHERIEENPLMSSGGRAEITELCNRHGVAIPSLTGDCFMQAPFWKVTGAEQDMLKNEFRAVVDSCQALGVAFVVVPLVDNGSLGSRAQEDCLIEFLLSETPALDRKGVKIVFESDFPPAELGAFIARLPAPTFGINYDIGNSAALGFDVGEEFAAYGGRVLNVHVKDRVLGGTTVPLGEGAASFEEVFSCLRRHGYEGNFILQTARAADGAHAATLKRYFDMVGDWAAAA